MKTKEQTKILFVASECAPIVKVGGLGDVIGSLPKELMKLGVDARVILPLYKNVDVKKYKIKPLFRNKRVKWGRKVLGLGLWEGKLPGSNVPAYFIENKKYLGLGDVYFSRTAVAQHKKEIERFVFFSEAVYALLTNDLLPGEAGLPFRPDIVHANDWHTGRLVELLSASNKKQKRTKTIFTIHNLGNQGISRGKNYIKLGIENADLVTTVSPTYAEEIQTKDYGFGLNALLRRKKPTGILNGFDHGSLKNFGAKDAHKLSFQEAHGLKRGKAHPLFGLVSRLHDQKGIQWVIPVVSCMVELFDVEFAFLGTGEDEFEEALSGLARRYPENVLTKIGFDEELAQSIYDASDFFLMPSVFEPCGLGQMISMHYGTLPIARATGGLKDTIEDGKNGFLFEEKNEKAFLRALQRALGIFVEEPELEKMRERALAADFSWTKSANQYKKLYKQLTANS